TVGVLGEFRLNTHFQLRIAPAMYFGTRHLSFYNMLEKDGAGNPIQQKQEMKTAYISSALDLIFAAQRFNNHRPYIMAGINPMMNLNSKNEDYIKLKKTDLFLELGLGCDFYLPYFKLRPELKFM
ncbi:PorT family protein, partial [Alcanivorax profundi]